VYVAIACLGFSEADIARDICISTRIQALKRPCWYCFYSDMISKGEGNYSLLSL